MSSQATAVAVQATAAAAAAAQHVKQQQQQTDCPAWVDSRVQKRSGGNRNHLYPLAIATSVCLYYVYLL